MELLTVWCRLWRRALSAAEINYRLRHGAKEGVKDAGRGRHHWKTDDKPGCRLLPWWWEAVTVVDSGDTLKAAGTSNYPLHRPKQAAAPPDSGQEMLRFSPSTFFLSATDWMCLLRVPACSETKTVGWQIFLISL